MRIQRGQIGVIGAGECSQKEYKTAFDVGKGIAEIGYVLVCGGLGGVMEGACKGAKEDRGLSVGVLPGDSLTDSNKYVDIKIVTSLSHARNNLVVRSSDLLVAIGGGYGTLSEIAIAFKLSKKVIGIKTWEVSPEIINVSNANEALSELKKLMASNR